MVSHRRCAPTSGIENSSYRNYIPVGLDTHKRTRHVPGGEAKRARCDRAESIAPKVVVITITRLALLMRSARLDGCIGDVSSPRQADFRYRLAEPPPPLVWNALLVANIPRITDRSRLRRRHLDTCPQPPLISPPSIRNSGGPWNMGCSMEICPPGSPLLVIAGAGSGKTNTLAHRVAHVIVNGADPRRILLMTFSRRAAVEMTRRVERIARQVMGNNAGVMTDALTWAGTFHGIGARLLRDYADQIGLDPAFTIHDREDSADLMNLCRHEARILEDGKPISDQGNVPRHLFAQRERGTSD